MSFVDLDYLKKKYRIGFYCDNICKWRDVLNKIAFVPCEYEENVMNYYSVWVKEQNEEYLDLSMYLYSADECIGLWSLFCKKNGNSWTIGTFYHEIEEPIFVTDISISTKRKYMKMCYELVCDVANMLNVHSLYFYTKQSFDGVSAWYRILQENAGMVSSVDNMLYMNLKKNEEYIWGVIRKRYKTHINKCKKEWKVSIIDSDDSMRFEEYKNYHHFIAGRVTRGADSWECQRRALRNKKAFMVFLHDIVTCELVGVSYFFLSKDEAIYLSGAYNREKYSVPVSHIVQYAAICYAKKRGLQLYRIGERYYKNSPKHYSAKEISISEFKEGFASNMFVNLICKVEI